MPMSVCMKLKDSGLLMSSVLKAHSLFRYGRLDAEMSIIKQTLLLSTREKSMNVLKEMLLWSSSSTVLCISSNMHLLVVIPGVQLTRSLGFVIMICMKHIV